MSRLFSTFSLKEQTLFAKRLAFLIRAGVPILESMVLLQKQMPSRAKNLLIGKIAGDIERGQYLHTSLATHKHVLSPFGVNVIRIGEMGGVLSQNLHYLSEELSKKNLLRRKILGSLVYPFFVMIATLVITLLLVLFVFPKVLPIFQSLQVVLPPTTRILIFVSDFLFAHGVALLIVLAISIAIFFVLERRLVPLRKLSHLLILNFPLVGRMANAYNRTNICRTMGLLLKSSIPVSESLRMTAETTENLVYRDALNSSAEIILTGKHTSECLERYQKLFPDILLQMLAIGERTGNLSDTFTYLSEMYEGEVEDLTKNLSSSIEPVLMVFMGLVVGFIAVSIIAPIYAVTQNLSK